MLSEGSVVHSAQDHFDYKQLIVKVIAAINSNFSPKRDVIYNEVCRVIDSDLIYSRSRRRLTVMRAASLFCLFELSCQLICYNLL